MKPQFFIGLLVLICVTACRQVTAPAALPSPGPAFTATLPATQTARLTMTATVTPKPSPTVTPAEIIDTPAAAPDLGGTVTALSEPRLSSSLLSPDGVWRVEVMVYDCTAVGAGDELAYEQLMRVSVDSGVAQIVASQLRYCGGLGAFGLEGLFWSANSRYFYYTDAREGVPDGCGYWERPITRLDVGALELVPMGGGPRSPDETRMATWMGRELVLWNLDEGEIVRIPAALPDAQIGPLVWSPDSQSLVYLQVASECPISGESYVVHLALPDLNPTVLLESAAPSFGGVIWDTPDELRLFDASASEWRYNLVTNELTPAP